MTRNKQFSLKMNYKDKAVKIFNNFDKENWRVLNLPFVDYADTKIVRKELEPVVDLLNDLSNENKLLNEEIRILEKEKEKLLDELTECKKLLLIKNVREEPHWHKYKNSKGYTAKTDSDIRFNGD